MSLLSPVGGVLPPYWVFKALPSICSDKLPRGYATFGFVVEPGHDLPIGVSRRRRIGIDQVGLNCAACHTGTVRDAPGATPRIVLGMPSQQLDLEAFVQFVVYCTLGNRMTADARTLLEHPRRHRQLGLLFLPSAADRLHRPLKKCRKPDRIPIGIVLDRTTE